MRNALKKLFDLYDTTGKVVLTLALIGLASSAAMAFFFGVSVSLMHGIFLIVVSIGFALGPHLAHKVWIKGARTSAVIIGMLCVPLGVVEWYSHNGYTAGLRGVDIGNAKVNQVSYGDTRASVETLTRRVAGFESRAKELDENLAKLTQRRVGNQVITVKPSSSTELDGAIAAKKLEVQNESKRGGCKSKCETRTNELAHLEALRATALAIEQNHAEHAAALGALAQAKNEATGKAAEYKYSAAEQQATSIAKLFALVSAGSLKPTDIQAEVVEQGANVGMSIAAMLQPALFFFIAGFFMAGPIRREQDEPAPIRKSAVQPSAHHHRPKSSWRKYYTPSCEAIGATPVAT
jgi:hypothetical protein